MFAIVINGAVTRYPYTLTDLRGDHPNVSFAATIGADTLAAFNLVEVADTDPPSYDPATQNIAEQNTELVDGVWQRVWSVTDATADEIAARKKSSVPGVISFRQAKTYLQLAGLWDGYVSAANAIADPVQRIKTLGFLLDSMEYERHRPELVAFATGLGLSDDQVDDMFIAAGKL